MKKELQTKTIASIAVLSAITIALAITIPIFWFKYASPLDKTIEITFVYPDQSPIGECLEVRLYDGDMNADPLMTGHTDIDGKVTFIGLVDETYTWKWSWQGTEYQRSEPITCEKIVWEFTQEVDYWTVEKTFVYDIPPDYPPVPGLPVTFDGQSGVTDENGLVTFVDVKAGDYVIEWIWGGTTYQEPVSIVFGTESPIVLTNYLGSKSGGGINLHLAEEFGR